MTVKQLARFGELILFEANAKRAEAQVAQAEGKHQAAGDYGAAALALFSIHKAILQLAKEV